MISDILGAKIINVQSRLLGYFSGNPGDFMTPLLEVKFLEHSGPAARTKGGDEKGSEKTRQNGDKGRGGHKAF